MQKNCIRKQNTRIVPISRSIVVESKESLNGITEVDGWRMTQEKPRGEPWGSLNLGSTLENLREINFYIPPKAKGKSVKAYMNTQNNIHSLGQYSFIVDSGSKYSNISHYRSICVTTNRYWRRFGGKVLKTGRQLDCRESQIKTRSIILLGSLGMSPSSVMPGSVQDGKHIDATENDTCSGQLTSSKKTTQMGPEWM